MKNITERIKKLINEIDQCQYGMSIITHGEAETCGYMPSDSGWLQARYEKALNEIASIVSANIENEEIIKLVSSDLTLLWDLKRKGVKL